MDGEDVADQTDPDAPVDEGAAAESDAPASAVDRLPGWPLAGRTDWRVGVPGVTGNLFGLVPTQALTARGGNLADGVGDPRLMQVADRTTADPSNVLGDYETHSWRWNDRDALAYDYDRKQRELAEAQNLHTAAGAVSAGRLGLGLARGVTGIGILGGPGAAIANTAVGQYMGRIEAPRLRKQIEALKNRLDQLDGSAS